MSDIYAAIDQIQADVAELRRGDRPITNVGARVYNSAAISIPNNTATILTFNSERYDTDGLHSVSVNTDRLTCTRSGVHLISASIQFAAAAGGRRQLYFVVTPLLGGAAAVAAEQRTPIGVTAADQITISAIYSLSAGDYVQLVAYQNSGGALNVDAAPNYSPEFMMHRLM